MLFHFADYILDDGRRELRRGSDHIAVEPQVLDLLIYLIENNDRVVTRDDLIASIWGGRITSDTTLTSRIYAARRAIGDNGRNQNLIRTIARKGIRFVGEVRIQTDDAPQHTMRSPLSDADIMLAQQTRPMPDRPAIAVLPFNNMSGDPEQEYFSDGISEDIIAALSKLRWFFVIARNSSFLYKGRAVHVKQIGEELGVGYVVEGSVRRSGGRVRITAQLNDVINGSHVWAERYDRDFADLFAVQDEITEAIVAAIEPQLYAAENFRARRKQPGSLDAWDLVMRALSYYWRVTRQDHAVAQELLEKAIAIDPHYGQALGVLSASYTFGAHMGWVELKDIAQAAERDALAAIRADSEDSLGALRARRFLSDHATLRRFTGRIRTGAAPQSEFLAGPELLRRGVGVLRPLGTSRRGGASRDPAESARSVPGAVLRLGLPRPVHRTQLRGSDTTGAHRRAPSQRLRRRPPRSDRRRRHGRISGGRCNSVAGASPRAAQHLAGLGCGSCTYPARRRPRPLSGRLSPGGSGLRLAYATNVRSPPPAPASAPRTAPAGYSPP